MDIEAELLKEMSNEDLEQTIKQKVKSFHGFLTREVALRLIAKEKGVLNEKETFTKISEITKGTKRISIEATVKRVWPIAQYGSGKYSRVVEIKDESGEFPLVLWNEDIDITKSLRNRDVISVKGAYEKNNELHLGYDGQIIVMQKSGFSEFSELKNNDIVHVRGYITKAEGVDSFVSGSNTGMAFSVILSDGNSERRCVFWERTGISQKLAIGDEVIIEDALINNDNIEVSSTARVLSRRPKDMLIGEIKEIKCSGELMKLQIGERSIWLDRENGLRFMGVDAASDISLSTITGLKKDTLLNSKIALKIEEKNGTVVVRG
ncbi:MAG: hypothetical protein ABIJ10_01625 [Candidatus Micrarchaeota archaeon]|nr:hypothetical protein [Candidatus Micrarchaeota archaeon]MBU1887073.1 hypothetical protein [Candidatus Micrarchaeota archaeon]